MNLSKRAYLPLLLLAVTHGSPAACAQSERVQTSDTVLLADVTVTKPGVEASGRAQKTADEQFQFAKEDLARRLTVDADDIELKTVRHIHWRSGAVGCPKPGMSYSMSIIPGVLILLQVDGEIYRYHAKQNGTPFYCPADMAESPVMGQGEEAF